MCICAVYILICDVYPYEGCVYCVYVNVASGCTIHVFNLYIIYTLHYIGKALRGRSSIVKRKASRVIDIMCRLVQDPTHVTPFEPLLLPALDRVIDEVTDEEVGYGVLYRTLYDTYVIHIYLYVTYMLHMYDILCMDDMYDMRCIYHMHKTVALFYVYTPY